MKLSRTVCKIKLSHTISILKITKGNIPQLSRTVSKFRADTISLQKISRGNYSAKNVGGVTVLISARRLIMLYICAKFREIISNGIKVMERTRIINGLRTDGQTDGQTLQSSEGLT